MRSLIDRSNTSIQRAMDKANEIDRILWRSVSAHQAVVRALSDQWPALKKIAEEMSRALLENRKIIWCGNGGSAADSQHLAAEFVGRFSKDRSPLASMALTTDSSVLTAISNDFGFEHVFERQVEALCMPGDVLVGITTSGRSKNVLLAIQMARRIGAFTAAFTGEEGSLVAAAAHQPIHIKSKNSARIQEAHILCGHILCECVDWSIIV